MGCSVKVNVYSSAPKPPVRKKTSRRWYGAAVWMLTVFLMMAISVKIEIVTDGVESSELVDF